jgi:Swi5-dependent recombination DNA repair protein 1
MNEQPPHKRPRLSSNGANINKPFRSPFRSPLKQISGNVNVGDARSNGSSRLTSADTVDSKPIDIGKLSTAVPVLSVHAMKLPPKTEPIKDENPPSSTHQSTFSPAKRPSAQQTPNPALSSPKPHFHPQQPTLSHLTSLTLSARRTNETLSHALSLITSPQKDAELQSLARKWRSASRSAAEEVFGYARDKVNGMGGMRGWKKREKEMRDRMNQGWNDDGAQKKAGNGGDGLERIEDERDPRDEVGVEEEVDEVDEAEDESFTMDIMLKSMGIDVDLLGYDKKKGMWIPEKDMVVDEAC